MKKVIRLLIVCIALTSCKSDPQVEIDGYVINGTAPGVFNGVRVHLKTVDNQQREVIKDTAIVMNETFIFKGDIGAPQLWYMTINSVAGRLPIIIENGEITISVNPENLGGSTISGSKSNDALTTYMQKAQELTSKRNALIAENRTLTTAENKSENARLAIAIRDINQELADYPTNFISEHPDNYFSLVLMESLIATPNTDFEIIEQKFNAMNSDLKASEYGKRVFVQLENKKLQMAKFSALDIGKVAPDFSAPNPDGNTLALSDIRGKVTIIDFWASWCGPCRKENPNVVKVFQKYHDKGLEIINVALDRPGHKDRWLKAIKDDKLTWHHVSNLNYFNDPIAKLYNINSIPATYILDESGKIVAKNLRGAALEAKIGELLN
ncbi:TlpA disulfide reductase family protein [Gelidibacter maritimus]|uniref:AhpC/TSA family protein n=1 Tax=Gelidibacter maritimus TaxID=2761487 RepID=A0A7W2M2J0_9FLAO|nr:TlpA disulfide reductase family protein [Gelidibacter maritimus]MBA6151502.1 AhpC/TSA family protein [Gelidibacter maritimus]